jgi:hypothetical protein
LTVRNGKNNIGGLLNSPFHILLFLFCIPSVPFYSLTASSKINKLKRTDVILLMILHISHLDLIETIKYGSGFVSYTSHDFVTCYMCFIS